MDVFFLGSTVSNDGIWSLSSMSIICLSSAYLTVCDTIPKKLWAMKTGWTQPCANPGIFARGVQVSLTKKALTTFFFFFFSPQLILQKSNGQFQISRF